MTCFIAYFAKKAYITNLNDVPLDNYIIRSGSAFAFHQPFRNCDPVSRTIEHTCQWFSVYPQLCNHDKYLNLSKHNPNLRSCLKGQVVKNLWIFVLKSSSHSWHSPLPARLLFITTSVVKLSVFKGTSCWKRGCANRAS